jgi:hypothetical protein
VSDALKHAQESKTLLDNPAFDRAFQNVREALVRGIEKQRGDANVDELILCLRLLGSVKTNLVGAINNGALDEFKLVQQKQRAASRLRSVFGR